MTTATSGLPARALATVRRHRLLARGDLVLAAVSGGADSVALLDVLLALAPLLGIRVAVAHVHHGLRAEADRDAEFVLALCREVGVPCHVERVRVRREPPWDGLEAEARRARHAALAARARAVGAARIATGHTADDQAETVLIRLLQGAGPRGLGGIAPARGPLVRPLIEARRADVAAHLAARGRAWVEDATNRDPRFLRNRVRHGLLPALAAPGAADVVASLGRLAAASRRWAAARDARAEAALDRHGTAGAAGVVVPAAALAALPDALGADVLLAAARRLGHAAPLRAPVHRALARLLDEPAPRGAARVGPLIVERSGRWLRVGPALERLAARALPVPGAVALREIGARVEARCFRRDAGYTPPRGPDRAAFDADRVPLPLVVRGRRPGDRFHPFGGSGARRLKRVLADAAVPGWDRARVPVLEAGGEILWAAGLRRGRAAPVTPDTERILEVTLAFP